MGTVVHLTDQSIQLSANNWNEAYDIATTYQNISSSLYQTLFYTESSSQISISNGNNITLDNLITKTQALAYSIAL